MALALAMLGGCARPGGRVYRYADAAQIPVAEDERDQLAALLAGYAQRNAMYFRDTTPRAQRTSNGRQTLALALDRTLTTGRPWSEIAVSAIGGGPALITFVAPPSAEMSADSSTARAELLSVLRRRWPGLQPVPVLPDGAIPRLADLRQTPAGLRIDRAKAAGYKLPANSPLLTAR
ncbi:MAG: hypothetical protein ABIP41_07485 [Croceibacterium sp.]